MIDRLIIEFDRGLRALLAESYSARPHPAPEKDSSQADTQLEDNEKRHAAALMRVNHCGEICAQALYNGQSLTARNLQLWMLCAKPQKKKPNILPGARNASMNWAAAKAC